jgi:cystathionine beta-lyase/cystathionine gamma-synthase
MKEIRMTQRQGFKTRSIHAGQSPDPVTGAVMTPIYATSTFKQSSPGVHQGYEYARTHNPTRTALEACMADLEEGSHGFAFASGMAAIDAVLNLLNHGDHVMAMDDLYGGTYRILSKVKTRTQNLQVSYVDLTQEEALTQALQSNTKMIWVESPSNPMLKLVDLDKIARFARQHQLLFVVDNTFCTPYLQKPLTFGADIVVHSGTKYLNGHSDVVCGLVVVKDTALADALHFIQNACGGILGPFDSFLVLRSLKTLALRMEAHCANAQCMAEWLATRSEVQRVIYPGLPEHPQYALAQRQMARAGGMISVVLDGDLALTRHRLERCRLFTLAESLGGVESLIEHPAIMTHASIPPEQRQALGLGDTFIRLSVGIEDVDDLINDVQQAWFF